MIIPIGIIITIIVTFGLIILFASMVEALKLVFIALITVPLVVELTKLNKKWMSELKIIESKEEMIPLIAAIIITVIIDFVLYSHWLLLIFGVIIFYLIWFALRYYEKKTKKYGKKIWGWKESTSRWKTD